MNMSFLILSESPSLTVLLKSPKDTRFVYNHRTNVTTYRH